MHHYNVVMGLSLICSRYKQHHLDITPNQYLWKRWSRLVILEFCWKARMPNTVTKLQDSLILAWLNPVGVYADGFGKPNRNLIRLRWDVKSKYVFRWHLTTFLKINNQNNSNGRGFLKDDKNKAVWLESDITRKLLPFTSRWTLNLTANHSPF